MAQIHLLLCGADEALQAAVAHHLKDEPDWKLLTHAAGDVAVLLVTPAALGEVTRRRCPAVLLAENTDSQTLEQALRLGVDGFVRVPDELRNLRTVISRALGATSPAAPAPQRGNVVALCSMKGGSGTSLLAANLAVLLQEQGQRTLLVDLHPGMGTAHTLLNVQPRRSWTHLLMVAGELKPRFVDSVACRVEPPGLTILPSPGAVEGADHSLEARASIEPAVAESLRPLIAALRQQYDVVVLDCPTGMSPITVAALQEATRIFYVITPDALAIPPMWAFKEALSAIPRLAGRKAELLVNRASRISELKPEGLAALFGVELAGHVVSDFGNIQWYINRGKPVASAGGGPFGRDLRRLASVIVPADPKGGESLVQAGAWLSRLFSTGAKGPSAGSGGR